MPLVSVVVVTWNRKTLLQECLEALDRQSFRDFEVIVVDNGSTDGSAELVRRNFLHVKLITLPENRGFSIGNNIGIRNAQGRYIALLNNDAVAEPGWLSASVSAIEQHPEVGFCASKMLFYDRRDLINSAGITYFTVGIAIDRGWMEPDGTPFDTPSYTLGACAGAALYRKSMLDEIGLFDGDFSPAYFEDVDLSLRAQLRGYRCLYVPSAVVHHRLGGTLGYKSFAGVYLGTRNQWYVVIKNMPTWLLLKYGPEIAVYAVLKLLFQMVKGEGTTPYLLGHLAAVRKFPVMLRKRLQVQRLRVISVNEFEALMTNGRLLSDVTRVLKRVRVRSFSWRHEDSSSDPR